MKRIKEKENLKILNLKYFKNLQLVKDKANSKQKNYLNLLVIYKDLKQLIY